MLLFPFPECPLAPESPSLEKELVTEEAQLGEILIQGLTEEMVTVLIRACVSMLGVPVDPDTLHATLRLCLRLTRDHKYALMFAELKSTRMILNLTQSSGFNGFTPLVTLLLRHIIEDPCTLQHTMEKVGGQCLSASLEPSAPHLLLFPLSVTLVVSYRGIVEAVMCQPCAWDSLCDDNPTPITHSF